MDFVVTPFFVAMSKHGTIGEFKPTMKLPKIRHQ